MSFKDLATMPQATLYAYAEHLPGLQAELKLIMAEVSVYPKVSDQDRRDMLARWQREAFEEPSVTKASPAILKMIGIGVR